MKWKNRVKLGKNKERKTMRNVAIEMAMDLCIDEKDEERESEAQPAVPGGGGGWGGARFFALTADCASLSRSSSFSSMQRSIAISIATFRVVFACSPDIVTVSDLLEFQISRFRRFVSGFLAVQAVQKKYFSQPIRVVSCQ